MRNVRQFLARFRSDQRGVAAVEMALVGALLTAALLNVVEIGRYAYVATQVTSASQAGAHAAIARCTPAQSPVTVSCPAAAAAIRTAIEGTSLGDDVSLDGALDEAWYCLNSEGGLSKIAAANGPKPTSCAGGGLPAVYLRVQVRYTFEPIFPGLTITERFPETVSRAAWMRLL